jgi:hypothetical protein
VHRDIIIVENFYSDPDAIVEYALGLEYCTPYDAPEDVARGTEIQWRSSLFQRAEACPFKSSAALVAKLEALTGETIDMRHWNRDFPLGNDGRPRPGYESALRTAWWNCCFHVKHHAQVRGEYVHNHDVTDCWNSAGPMGWAGIVYLSKNAARDSGLSIWRNRHGRHDDRFTAKEDWELIDTVANVYNRLILHRGYISHSGAGGWGKTLADGRLFQTFFFSTLAPKVTAPVSLQDLQLPPVS